MTTQEQANRTADLVLELVQARRKLAAIRRVIDALRAHPGQWPSHVAEDLEAALGHQPPPPAQPTC